MTRTSQEIVNRLITVEMDAAIAPDMRRVIRDERMALQTAIDSGDAARISMRHGEAVRTAALWGVDVA